MRQLLVQVPPGDGDRVLEIAQRYQGTHLARWAVTAPGGRQELVLVHVSNRKVEGLLQDLEPLPDLQVTLIPHGVMTLQPPPDEAPEQVTDVGERSPLEVFLGSLQSVGSWKGFLGYAAAAGIVVWIGLFTNTLFLLVAAMLIAPFASPAMEVAMGTARGDRQLIQRGLLRYCVALSVTITVSALLSFLMRQEVATRPMVDASQVASVAVLLPLVAGGAGALNLVQSQRSSLVSGAATGVLVAAALAPPAGLMGMAAALGRWEMVRAGAFLLLLQLVAINLGGSLVFRLYGLSARGARYERGKPWVLPASLAVTGAALGGLLFWQFSRPPDLQLSTRAQRATAAVQKVINDSGQVDLVEANVRFTGAKIQGQETLLGVIYVQRRPQAVQPPEALRAEITRAIQQHLVDEGFHVTPLIDVTVLTAPLRSSAH